MEVPGRSFEVTVLPASAANQPRVFQSPAILALSRLRPVYKNNGDFRESSIVIEKATNNCCPYRQKATVESSKMSITFFSPSFFPHSSNVIAHFAKTTYTM